MSVTTTILLPYLVSVTARAEKRLRFHKNVVDMIDEKNILGSWFSSHCQHVSQPRSDIWLI
ncbi:hypothetical protein GBA52_006834 [Prunus armeniaca]|nr:hypothetical protein GBA52_006834 [Prunus armeniaca]